MLAIGLLSHALMLLLYVTIVACDVTLFFVLAKFLATKWDASPFRNFSRAGKPITEPLFRVAQDAFRVDERACFLGLSIGLSACRCCLVVVIQALASGSL